MNERFNYQQEKDFTVIQPLEKWSVADLSSLLQELYILGYPLEKVLFDFSVYASLPVFTEPRESLPDDGIENMLTKGIVKEIRYQNDLNSMQTFSFTILNTPQISDGVVVQRVMSGV